MTAYTIIVLVLCSLAFLVDALAVFGSDPKRPNPAAVGFAIINMLVLAPVIIALALVLS